MKGIKMNKEKEGKTIRFSVRLPKSQHEWLKEQSGYRGETNRYVSMNRLIAAIIQQYIER